MVRASIRTVSVVLWTCALLGLVSGTALAHDQPAGADYLMSDWMFYTFAIFAGAALIVTLVAYKRGVLYHLEESKLPMLLIPEEDYYTPEWALEEGREP